MIHPKEDAKKTLEYCKKFKQLRLATQHQRQKQSAGNEAFDKRLCWFMESKHGQKLEIKDGTESEKEPRKTLLRIIATAIIRWWQMGWKDGKELAKAASKKDFTHILCTSQEQHQRQHCQRIIDETRQRAMAEIDIRGNRLKDPKTCLSYF